MSDSAASFPPRANDDSVRSVRRTAYVALFVALVHIVFGAIVRISGSGMGCGDNWPKCMGYWIPPFERVDLIIEVTHRYLALTLFVSIAALAATAWRARSRSSVGGKDGVLRASMLALGLWFAPALFGAVTVFTGNPPWATVVHKLLAASLIAVLAAVAIRAGGLGGRALIGQRASDRAWRSATAAAVLALTIVLLGGLTAKLPGAAVACAGFPLCGAGSTGGSGQYVQLTHRILAYLLVLHLVSLPFVFRKRAEAAPLVQLAWAGLVLGVMQVMWAAWMVTGGFPAVVRSLHQATGILIWVVTFSMMYLARIATGRTSTSPTRASADGLAMDGVRG